MADEEILRRAVEGGEDRLDGSSFRVLVAEVGRLRAERDAILRRSVRHAGYIRTREDADGEGRWSARGDVPPTMTPRGVEQRDHGCTPNGIPILTLRDKLDALRHCLEMPCDGPREDAMGHLLDLMHHIAPGWQFAGLEGIEAIAACYGKKPAPIIEDRTRDHARPRRARGGGVRRGGGAVTELERWIRGAFRRRGGDMIAGPIVSPLTLCREDVDVLLDNLACIRSNLPTLDQRLRGLSTCETCGGEGGTGADCAACKGDGFAPRPSADF